MNQSLIIFKNHNLMVCNQTDDLIQYIPTEGTRNYNIFFYFRENKVLKVPIIGYQKQINMPIMDFEKAQTYYFQSLQQLNEILRNICF